MALNRQDACRHFVDGANFVKCLVYYVGTSGEKSSSWEVVVVPADLPAEQQVAPTDAQVNAVADAKATTIYNAWLAAIAADTVVESPHTGLAAVVVA